MIIRSVCTLHVTFNAPLFAIVRHYGGRKCSKTIQRLEARKLEIVCAFRANLDALVLSLKPEGLERRFDTIASISKQSERGEKTARAEQGRRGRRRRIGRSNSAGMMGN